METIRTALHDLAPRWCTGTFQPCLCLGRETWPVPETQRPSSFVVQACGTGQMIESLEHDEVDVIVALTEGLVRHILTQPTDVRLLGTYVNSPPLVGLFGRGPEKKRGPPWTAKPLGTAGLVPALN